MMNFKKRLINTFDAISQLVNVAILPDIEDTTPNESISGRAFRKNWGVQKLINFICFWEKDHCRKAFYKDVIRAREYIQQASGREK